MFESRKPPFRCAIVAKQSCFLPRGRNIVHCFRVGSVVITFWQMLVSAKTTITIIVNAELFRQCQFHAALLFLIETSNKTRALFGQFTLKSAWKLKHEISRAICTLGQVVRGNKRGNNCGNKRKSTFDKHRACSGMGHKYKYL